MCDNCGRADHPQEGFDFYLKLRFGDRGRGEGAPRAQGDTCIGANEKLVMIAAPTT